MDFNKSQMSAIEHKDGPMLVLAGPGSGKTAVLVERTKNLIEKYRVSPSNILVITFTKAAAKEMEQRFSYSKEMEGRVTFGTFHAVFFKILKLAYHYTASNIIKDDVKYSFFRSLIEKYALEFRDEGEFISGMLSEISLIKNSNIPLETFYSSQCGAEIFRKIYKDYSDFLRKNRLIDFDDMLTLTLELLKERPDILSAWQKKYQYILVDEFQDINQIQYEIIRLLAAPNNNLFMVGDDDQSIYRFRGSKPEIMLNIPKDYPDLKQVLLDVNFRCPKEVIEVSLNLIKRNKNRFMKQIIPAKSKEETGKVEFNIFLNPREEIAFIVERIRKFLECGGAPSDVAILFRTNTQATYLMGQLMAYNIDFKTRDQIPNIYEHWIAKDLFAYINIAKGSRSRRDFLMIINKPNRYIRRDSLYDSQVSWEELEKLYEEEPWMLERIEKLACDIKMLGRLSPYAAINYIRHGIGYEDYIEDYADYRGINKEDLYEILDELQASAKDYKTFELWEKHIKEYTKELKEQAQKREENPNAVTLSTMHSAKGLEFKMVFVIDINEGITPYKKALLDSDMEEERRLFYVAVTRTKEKLYLCSVKTMHDRELEISRFVKELQDVEQEMK